MLNTWAKATLAGVTGLLAASGAWAQDGAAATDDPVVVELYTSQGCSSCPPADALLTELAARGDVIALALHVDYWDYIGWTDPFGDPAHTRRQKAYARAAMARTIYTPQMVIAGVDHVVGARPMQVMDLIQRHSKDPDLAELTLRRDGSTLAITLAPVGPLPDAMVVQVVRYLPEEVTEIESGENGGRTMRYSNIVTDWREIGTWDGKAETRMHVEVDGPVAVIVQERGPGEVVAAAQLR